MSITLYHKVFLRVIHLLLIVLFFQSCRQSFVLNQSPKPAYSISAANSNLNDSAAEKLILPYRNPLEKSMQEVVAVLDSPAVKGLPESSLGNIICDILLEETQFRLGKKIDFCFLNTGGLRVEWPQGAITRSMVYELMPFENQLQVASFSGEQVLDLCRQIAGRNGGPVAGVTLEIKNNMLLNARIGTHEIDPKEIYQVVSSDYLLNGGDKYIIPKPISIVPLNVLLRDAILEYFERIKMSGKIISPRKDGRIINIDTP